jgi:hypothetical protein
VTDKETERQRNKEKERQREREREPSALTTRPGGLKLKQACGPHWTKFKSQRAALYHKIVSRATHSNTLKRFVFKSEQNVLKKNVKTLYFHRKN